MIASCLFWGHFKAQLFKKCVDNFNPFVSIAPPPHVWHPRSRGQVCARARATGSVVIFNNNHLGKKGRQHAQAGFPQKSGGYIPGHFQDYTQENILTLTWSRSSFGSTHILIHRPSKTGLFNCIAINYGPLERILLSFKGNVGLLDNSSTWIKNVLVTRPIKDNVDHGSI